MSTRERLLNNAIVVVLIVVSAIPGIVLLRILGELNLEVLVVLWIVLLLVPARWPLPLLVAIAGLFALAMAVPPYPNWVSISNEGHLRLSFIGSRPLLEDIGGTVMMFVFYLALFLPAGLLLRRYRRSLSSSG